MPKAIHLIPQNSENGMNTAIYVLEKSIRDRKQKLEMFAQVIKDNEDSIIGVNIAIQEVSLDLDGLKRAIEVIKNA